MNWPCLYFDTMLSIRDLAQLLLLLHISISIMILLSKCSIIIALHETYASPLTRPHRLQFMTRSHGSLIKFTNKIAQCGGPLRRERNKCGASIRLQPCLAGRPSSAKVYVLKSAFISGKTLRASIYLMNRNRSLCRRHNSFIIMALYNHMRPSCWHPRCRCVHWSLWARRHSLIVLHHDSIARLNTRQNYWYQPWDSKSLIGSPYRPTLCCRDYQLIKLLAMAIL